MPRRYTHEDAREFQAAACNFVAACQMCAESERALRKYLPTVSAGSLMEAALELDTKEGIDLAASMLEQLSGQPLREDVVEVPVPGEVDIEQMFKDLGVSIPEEEEGESNISRVYRAVRQHPGITRVELANKTGLTAGQVSSTLSNLRRLGYAHYSTGESGNRGRPSATWCVTDKEGWPKADSTQQDARIIEFIVSCPEEHFRTQDLSQALGRSGPSLSSSLTSLAKKGLIVKEGSPGTWLILAKISNKDSDAT